MAAISIPQIPTKYNVDGTVTVNDDSIFAITASVTFVMVMYFSFKYLLKA